MVETAKPRLRTEQRSHLDKRLITVIETGENSRYYVKIPQTDFQKLMDIYDNLNHPGIQIPNYEFGLKINGRLYTEWCQNTPWEKHAEYSGESFFDFISNETHYALERTGKSKSEENEIREKVLEGLVKRAIELFSDWKGNSSPPYRTEKDESGRNRYIYDNKRNLRCDLRKYIGF